MNFADSHYPYTPWQKYKTTSELKKKDIIIFEGGLILFCPGVYIVIITWQN